MIHQMTLLQGILANSIDRVECKSRNNAKMEIRILRLSCILSWLHKDGDANFGGSVDNVLTGRGCRRCRRGWHARYLF